MCLELNLPHPNIPAIFLPNLSLMLPPIPFGTVGVTCCHFTLPNATIDLSAAIAAALAAGGPAALVLNSAITAMQATIDAGLAVLDQIHAPDCPLE